MFLSKLCRLNRLRRIAAVRTGNHQAVCRECLGQCMQEFVGIHPEGADPGRLTLQEKMAIV